MIQTNIFALIMVITLVAASVSAAEDSMETFANASLQDASTWQPTRVADHRLLYATQHPLQFGDLWLPQGDVSEGDLPVVVFVHGGGYPGTFTDIGAGVGSIAGVNDLGYSLAPGNDPCL
jgi:acetyl esterase/lipase